MTHNHRTIYESHFDLFHNFISVNQEVDFGTAEVQEYEIDKEELLQKVRPKHTPGLRSKHNYPRKGSDGTPGLKSILKK